MPTHDAVHCVRSLISPYIEFIHALTNGCQPYFWRILAKSCIDPLPLPTPKEIPDHVPRSVPVYMTLFTVHWQFIVFSRFVIDINWFSVVVECWTILRYRNIRLDFLRLVPSMTIHKELHAKAKRQEL